MNPRRLGELCALVMVLGATRDLHAQQRELRTSSKEQPLRQPEPRKMLQESEIDTVKKQAELQKKEEQLAMERAKKLVEKRDGVCYTPQVLEAKAKDYLAKETKVEATKPTAVTLTEAERRYLASLPSNERTQLMQDLFGPHADALRTRDEIRMRIQQHAQMRQVRQVRLQQRR